MDLYLISQNLFSFTDDSKRLTNKILHRMIREKPRLTIRDIFEPNFEVSDNFTTSKVNIARWLNHHDESKIRCALISSPWISQIPEKTFRFDDVTISLVCVTLKKEKLSNDCCVNIEADNIMFGASQVLDKYFLSTKKSIWNESRWSN